MVDYTKTQYKLGLDVWINDRLQIQIDAYQELKPLMTDNQICMPVETYNQMLELMQLENKVLQEHIDDKKMQRSGWFIMSILTLNFLVLTAAIALGNYLVGCWISPLMNEYEDIIGSFVNKMGIHWTS